MNMKYIEKETFENLNMDNFIRENEAYVSCKFVNCKFRNVHIENCEFFDCVFDNCDIVTLTSEESDIKNAKVNDSNIIGLHWDALSSMSYSLVTPLKSLQNSYLKYNNFVHLSLVKADLSNNTFEDCMFDNCDLTKANFKKSVFTKSAIANSNLTEADFREASEYYIDITTNKLSGAKFTFPEVSNLLNSLDIVIE